MVPGQRPYKVLRIAALLRQLVLDKQPLVDEVRRGRNFKITEQIAVGGQCEQLVLDLNPVLWAAGDGTDPDRSLVSRPVRQLLLDEFLKTRIMSSAPYEYSVQDVIRQLAHVSGPVHVGKPESAKERALTDIAQNLQIGGYEPAMLAIRSLGSIEHKALLPLKTTVEHELDVLATVDASSTNADNPDSKQSNTVCAVKEPLLRVYPRLPGYITVRFFGQAVRLP